VLAVTLFAQPLPSRRYVLSPTTQVSLSVLASVVAPAHGDGRPERPDSIAGSGPFAQGDVGAATTAPAAARLRLLDLQAAKEAAWDTGAYAPLAEDPPPSVLGAVGRHGETSVSSSSTLLALPALTLAPGRYLAILELDQADAAKLGCTSRHYASGMGSGPADGNKADTAGVSWRLQLLLNGDEKVRACTLPVGSDGVDSKQTNHQEAITVCMLLALLVDAHA
jgi:hypothetical protein